MGGEQSGDDQKHLEEEKKKQGDNIEWARDRMGEWEEGSVFHRLNKRRSLVGVKLVDLARRLEENDDRGDHADHERGGPGVGKKRHRQDVSFYRYFTTYLYPVSRQF